MPKYYIEVNYIINIEKNFSILKPKIYSFIRKKTKVVKVYINNILKKSFIYLSILLYIVPILIIYKPRKGLYIYINYYTLLAIKKTFIYINKISIISIINIIIAFNIVYIKKDKKKKTIFFIYYSLYKYLIILFRLYNISSIF